MCHEYLSCVSTIWHRGCRKSFKGRNLATSVLQHEFNTKKWVLSASCKIKCFSVFLIFYSFSFAAKLFDSKCSTNWDPMCSVIIVRKVSEWSDRYNLSKRNKFSKKFHNVKYRSGLSYVQLTLNQYSYLRTLELMSDPR